MKNTKKFAAFVASILAVACMAAPMATSFSADAAKNTISFTGANVGTHKYQAYMIFSGTAADNGFGGSAELKDAQWANPTGADAFLAALKSDSTLGTDFTNCNTAAAVASVLKDYESNGAKAKAFADFAIANKTNLMAVGEAGTSITAAQDGYYVIEETEVANGGTMTAHLLGVYDASAGAEITVKSEMPTFQKKIKDTNDSETEDGSTNGVWQDSADYDIGDDVPFQLTATLPNDYATYEQYKLVFHDNLQDSVYGDAENIKVYYQKGDTKVDITDFTSATPNTADAKFAATHEDTTCNLEVTIANLKELVTNAEAGGTVVVEYTAKLKDTAKLGTPGNWNSGYLEYSNNPYHTGEGDTTSKTTEDMVVAFTYQLSVDKVDGSGNALEGAGFTLYKYNPNSLAEDKYDAVGSEITGVTTFEFKGVDAGKYKLVESTVPNGYNQAAALEFVVSATHDENADAPTLMELTVANNNGESMVATELSAGMFTVDMSTGALATKIVNNSGSELPSTGGIGTTIFYVAGGALVVGAGVLLVSKKRMSNK